MGDKTAKTRRAVGATAGKKAACHSDLAAAEAAQEVQEELVQIG